MRRNQNLVNMKKLISFLLFACISLICFEGRAYDPYYLRQVIYKKYGAILKKEAEKVNDKYLAYYVCEPDVSSGLDNIPTLFVITVNHTDKTMQAKAYSVIFNESTREPELKTCDIPMTYANFKTRRQGANFILLQQTQTGWDMLRYIGGPDCQYKTKQNYQDYPDSNMRPINPTECKNLQTLKAAFNM